VLIIEVTNAREVVRQRIGRLGGRLIGKVVDAEAQVEKALMQELESAFRIHAQMGSILGGVHLEMTGDNVTECTGGARGLSDEDLARAYVSTVDPRLNYEQALEVALRISRWQDHR
jgi:3-deoxy-D-arabino-heptulosonate 7-phosphate (DAHP) synthase class II